MIVIVITLPSLGTGPYRLSSQASSLARLAGLDAHKGRTNNLDFGSRESIIPPISAPAAAEPPHDPITYTVGDKDDLGSIADQFHVTLDEVRWSNASLTSTDVVKKGQHLMLPPVAGLVATVGPQDTVQSLATRYHVDPALVIDFNYLLDPTHVPPGTLLVLPGGRGPDLFPRSATNGRPQIGPFPNGKFTFGQCTWFAASMRPVPWTGDAGAWYGAAQQMGFPVSSRWAPAPGAFMISRDNPRYGHVVWVAKVYQDGSFDAWEMNYKYWDGIDVRHITPDQYKPGKMLIGFIYMP